MSFGVSLMGHNQLVEKIDMNRVEKCYCACIVYVCVLGHSGECISYRVWRLKARSSLLQLSP